MTRQIRRAQTREHLTLVERIKQAIAYGRVSTLAQAEAETIGQQKVKLLSDIAAKDIPGRDDRRQLAGQFWDDGVSGAIDLDDRPEGSKIVTLLCANGDLECRGRDAKPGELSCNGADIVIDELWITKLDRLGRTLLILIEIERFLSAHGVALISLDFGINTGNASGRLIFQILGAIAQWERETIHERTTGGRYAKAAEGKWPGGRPPYGMHTDEDGWLVVDEDLIKVVEEIFANVGAGATAWAEGIRTGLGEARVRNIIHNRRYKGETGILAGGETWIEGKAGKLRQVISPEKWQLAQDQLTENSKNADRNRHYDYLLTGEGVRVLTCLEPFGTGICGRTFAGRSEGRHQHQEKYVYYYCSRSREDPEHTAKMLRGKDLEDAVWAEVEAVLRDPGKYLDEARAGTDNEAVVRSLRVELTNTIEQLAKNDTAKERTVRAWEDGERSEESKKARLAELESQAAPLRAHRAALEVQLRSAALASADDERARMKASGLLEVLDRANATDDRALKRELIKAVVKRAEVRTVDGQAIVKLLLRVGGELSIARGARQGAPANEQQHELIVVREIRAQHPLRRGPAPGSVRRPDVAARNRARPARAARRDPAAV